MLSVSLCQACSWLNSSYVYDCQVAQLCLPYCTTNANKWTRFQSQWQFLLLLFVFGLHRRSLIGARLVLLAVYVSICPLSLGPIHANKTN